MSRTTPNHARDILEPTHSTQISMGKRTNANHKPMKWACSDEPVNWSLSYSHNILTDPGEMVPHIRIIKIHVVPTGKDDLGQIQDAKLQISSRALIHNIQAVDNDDLRPDFELPGCSGVCINEGISVDEPGTHALTDRNIFFPPNSFQSQFLAPLRSRPHYLYSPFVWPCSYNLNCHGEGTLPTCGSF